MTDPSAKATFAILTETVDFLRGRQSPAKMLGAFGTTMPLHVCGDIDSQCFSTGVRAVLHCTNCESVRYCGPVHQRSVCDLLVPVTAIADSVLAALARTP